MVAFDPDEILYDPERRWGEWGDCTDEDPELFFPAGGAQLNRSPAPATQAAWDKAKAICARCPVLAECRRDTLGEEYGVYGGRDEHQRYIQRRKLPDRAKRWPAEKRLAWGKELTMLRESGMSYSDVRTRTGISTVLADALQREWAEHLQEQAQPMAEVVDLPLPKLLPARPVKDGRRHAWVWTGHLWADAYYRGETEDGAWLLFQVRAGKGESVKWLRAEHVHLYNPQSPEIVTYTGRPDGPQARAS